MADSEKLSGRGKMQLGIKKKLEIKEYKRDIVAALLIAAVFLGLCIYRLATGGEFSGDEFFTLEDTLGFAYTGQFYEWDFGTGAVSDKLLEFKSDFFLLGLWIRVFGESAVALRGLTVIYSLFTVLSFYYICRKLTKSFEWTVIASLFWAVNVTFVTISTIVRGYGLMVLLMTWVFYFSYQMLNYEKNFEPKNKLQTFWYSYFNFGYHYAFAALALLIAAFYVRVYVLLYMVGLATYVLWKGIRTKNKKFYVWGSTFWGIVVALLLGATIQLDKWIPFTEAICHRIRKYAAIGFRNIEYISDMGALLYFAPITVLGVLLLIYCLFIKKREIEEGQKDALTYCCSIVMTTLLFFLLIVDWSHSSRYLLAIYPLAVIAISGGFCLYSKEKQGIFRGFFYGILCCCLFASVKEVLSAEGEEVGKFQEAYTELADYLEDKPTFITGRSLRQYYAREILGEYEWQPMTSKSDVPDTDNLAELSEIGRAHPIGIITCDDEKWYHFRSSFWKLLNAGAFERITGPGVDETGVSNWAYHVCHSIPGEEINLEESDTVLFGYNLGGALRIREEEGKTVVELQINGSVSERMLLCLKVNQYHADGKTERYVQLVLEPNDSSTQYYRIELKNEGFMPNKSVLDDKYYIYTNEDEPQEFEDCYVMN